MKFQTGLPGLTRYPPGDFAPGTDNWQARMSAGDYQRIARAADDLGYDSIAVSEHVALPVEFEPNMGASWPHALTGMAFMAGATTRIKVTASVMVLPYHHPVPLAKAISTLDVLSGGRVILACGTGMAPAEFAAVGVPFERRGAVTDEYVAAMKALWTQDRPEFHGEWVQFADVVFEPKPVQRPNPPIWFGGMALVSLRRAANVGDGWIPNGGFLGKGPWFEGPETLPALLAEVREARAAAGNDRPFDVSLPVVRAGIGPGHTQLLPPVVPTSAAQIIDEIGRLESVGVTWTSVARPSAQDRSVEEYIDNLAWIADEVIKHCR